MKERRREGGCGTMLMMTTHRTIVGPEIHWLIASSSPEG